LKEKQQQFNSQWQGEKQLLEAISALKKEEDSLRVQIEQAERAYDLNKAAQPVWSDGGLQRDRESQRNHAIGAMALGIARTSYQPTLRKLSPNGLGFL